MSTDASLQQAIPGANPNRNAYGHGKRTAHVPGQPAQKNRASQYAKINVEMASAKRLFA